MGKCSKCRQDYDQDKVDVACCDHCGMPVVAPVQQADNSAMDAIALVVELALCGEKFTLDSAYMAQLIDQARGIAQRHQ